MYAKNKKIETLTNEKETLINEFRINLEKEKLNRIKEIDEEVKELKLIDKIKNINSENRIKKDLIEKFLKVGIIDPKFITNDGKLNKNLEKQNPLLYSLTKEYETRFGFDYNQSITIRIYKNYKTFEFILTYVDYKIPKQDRIQILFLGLETACKGNKVLFQDLKISEVKKQLANINKATEKMKLQEKEYNETLNKNNSYFLDSEKFLYSSNANIYLKTSY